MSADAVFERRAAAATLVALRALLPVPAEGLGWGYALLPDRVPLERQDAIQALVTAPKPLVCVALGLGGCLAIATWSGVAVAPYAAHAAAIQHDAAWGARRAQQRREVPAARLLFAIEGEEPVVLSLEEVWAWEERYTVLGLTYAWCPVDPEPDALTRREGATARVRFSRMQVSPSGRSGGTGLVPAPEAPLRPPAT